MIYLYTDDEAYVAAQLSNADVRAERVWTGDGDTPAMFLLRSDDLDATRKLLSASRLPTRAEAA
jgi:hypothetical protein